MYGKEIKAIRKANKISQETLEKATGIPQATISWIESEKGIPNIEQCAILADFYEISIDELIGRDNLSKSKFTIDQRHNQGTINNNIK